MRHHWLHFCFVLALWGLLSPSASAVSPSRPLQRISVLGREYVRASNWAASAGLRPHWISQDQELELSNGHFNIHLIHDSRRVRCNGVWVWISAPVIMRDHETLIPFLDIGSTFAPLLAPQKTSAPLRVICLDPGHGGDDTGKREGPRFEKQYTLLLAQEIARLLSKAGYKVILTRSSDKKIELTDRPLMARKAKADLFLSLHFNAAEVPSAQGIEVYCLTPVGASSTNAGGEGADSPASPGNKTDDRNMQLAYTLQKTLVETLGREDRGVRRARFAVLRGATMPSALIEAAFMSHPNECRCIYSTTERTRLAKAIVQGIAAYRKWTSTP